MMLLYKVLFIYFCLFISPLFIMIIFMSLNNFLGDMSFYEILFYFFFEGFAEKIMKIIVMLFLCYKNPISIFQYFKLNKMSLMIFSMILPIMFWSIDIEAIFSYSKILLPGLYSFLNIITLFVVVVTTCSSNMLIMMYIEAMFEEIKNSVNPPVLPQSDMKTEDMKSDIMEEEKKMETPFYYSSSFMYPVMSFVLLMGYTMFSNS